MNEGQKVAIKTVGDQMVNAVHPKVFISYSWEEESHKLWVKELADKLLADGIDATVDQYDLSLGDRLPQFMEQSISGADYVLIICTPTYKEKSDARKGGVGYEGHIISAELLSYGNERKFIPIIRKGTITQSLPKCLSGKLGLDLTEGKHYETGYKDLVTTIYGAQRKPPLGNTPSRVKTNAVKSASVNDDEPIKILGIIADEVTVPKMDGTRGSALYKIPFRLSKTPSRLWVQLFLAIWQSPPTLSTMHRFGIASVYGDKVILDGTTIEEVRNYHRDTLLLCVEEANKKEAAILQEEKARQSREQTRKDQHYQNVNSVIGEIKF